MSVSILIGDCRERMAELPDASIDSCVTDPPYHLVSQDKRDHRRASPSHQQREKIKQTTGFMGQTWDGGDVAFDPDTWRAVWRVLKPGAHLVAFSGTRTYHRMVCAIEDAGFEIRDQLAWVYGSGFPKSHDVSKGIDKAAGAEREVVSSRPLTGTARIVGGQGRVAGGRAEELYATKAMRDTIDITAPATPEAEQWQGWGTALKPAWEPICLARKPLIGTVANNVLAHGTGALNIDGCRVEGADAEEGRSRHGGGTMQGSSFQMPDSRSSMPAGRWPANFVHDGSDEVLAGFPSEARSAGNYPSESESALGIFPHMSKQGQLYADSGSAARFFYTAKASKEDRGHGNNHPTVKPTDLMRWLCRLVTPSGGTVLDPFAGSGSTLVAANMEQFNAIGCELSPDYAAIAERRILERAGLFAEVQAT